ncbi:hypothetical protein MT325_m747L [Paramecium bursaria chlorella virus MT325]|uniref:Uncharacterized protein m747L n=1 Tax=Paramecium bursaria Chlorella virus MT325 TaxID=346932 RepID=A7IVC7_PBCVM|nr:hypothetical protein MT325_m747L [Paramecium bursaria chlorella virus MT325]
MAVPTLPVTTLPSSRWFSTPTCPPVVSRFMRPITTFYAWQQVWAVSHLRTNLVLILAVGHLLTACLPHLP